MMTTGPGVAYTWESKPPSVYPVARKETGREALM
jgi:hypothetical protein